MSAGLQLTPWETVLLLHWGWPCNSFNYGFSEGPAKHCHEASTLHNEHQSTMHSTQVDKTTNACEYSSQSVISRSGCRVHTKSPLIPSMLLLLTWQLGSGVQQNALHSLLNRAGTLCTGRVFRVWQCFFAGKLSPPCRCHSVETPALPPQHPNTIKQRNMTHQQQCH